MPIGATHNQKSLTSSACSPELTSSHGRTGKSFEAMERLYPPNRSEATMSSDRTSPMGRPPRPPPRCRQRRLPAFSALSSAVVVATLPRPLHCSVASRTCLGALRQILPTGVFTKVACRAVAYGAASKLRRLVKQRAAPVSGSVKAISRASSCNGLV